MPVKTEVIIKPLELHKGDRLMGWQRDDVATGVTKLNPGMTVDGRVLKTRNVVVTFANSAQVLFRSDAKLRVHREVATEEEKAESRRKYRDMSIRRAMEKALAMPAAKREAITKKLSEADRRVGVSIAELGASLAVAEALEHEWLIILGITLDEENGLDLVDSYDRRMEDFRRDLLRRGADDTWSGRLRNDIARMIFDSQRELASDQWL